MLELKRTQFGHLGVFPEQGDNWQWIAEQVRLAGGLPPRVLNLFAYTGGSTLAAAAAGAEVVHVDAAKNIVAWARRNAALSCLPDAPVHWIVDDAMKFVKRELRRGSLYDAVILDLTVPGGMGGLEAMEALRKLDPEVRAIVSSGYSSDPVLANYRAHGGTVVLTTHYMEEAQRLCDRVAILDRGRLIRLGTPAELIAGLGAEHVVELELEAGVGQGALDEATLRGLPTVIEAHLSGEGVWTLAAVEPEQAVPALRTLLQERGQHLVRLVTRKATLEDVFVSLTGRALRDG